ncbi:thiamine phosphate synthase, partial [Craterilacuibacter sp.]|uniref:thiamine phosphate synthase n=1 Tax=Craterilacuibacter sp. TaxID=2870909 RepID=UPI003F3DDFE8
ARLLQDLAPRVHAQGSLLLAKADPAWLAGLPVDGVHVSADVLARLEVRPDFAWVGTDASSAEALAYAAGLGLDYAVLATDGPARPVRNWDTFSAALAAGIPLPVFAAGQGGADGLSEARRHGAHGVALSLGKI